MKKWVLLVIIVLILLLAGHFFADELTLHPTYNLIVAFFAIQTFVWVRCHPQTKSKKEKKHRALAQTGRNHLQQHKHPRKIHNPLYWYNHNNTPSDLTTLWPVGTHNPVMSPQRDQMRFLRYKTIRLIQSSLLSPMPATSRPVFCVPSVQLNKYSCRFQPLAPML